MGQNYFIPTPASGDVINALPGGPEGMGTILQGFLEASNINVVDEMVNMILSQRAYEANSKVIKSADDMLQMANNVVKLMLREELNAFGHDCAACRAPVFWSCFCRE